MRVTILVVCLCLISTFASSLSFLSNLKDPVHSFKNRVCDSFGYFCPCLHHEDFVDRFEAAIREHVFGQNETLALLSRYLRLHSFSVAGKGPTLIHIAGDNGVGKTLTSTIIAQSLFKGSGDLSKLRGYLYLRGDPIQGEGHEAEENFRMRLISQLDTCPNSLIVFDEAERISEKALDVLHPFLDATVNIYPDEKHKVRLNQAIYLFISDFGVEGFTSNKTLHDLRQMVDTSALKYWKHVKFANMVQFIIPFIGITEAGLRDYIEHRLKTLDHEITEERNLKHSLTIEWKEFDKILDRLTRECWELGEVRSRHYRGARNHFDTVVKAFVLEKLNSFDQLNGDKRGVTVIGELIGSRISLSTIPSPEDKEEL